MKEKFHKTKIKKSPYIKLSKMFRGILRIMYAYAYRGQHCSRDFKFGRLCSSISV